MAAQEAALYRDEGIDPDEKYVGENDLRRLKKAHFNAGVREGIAAGRQSKLQDGFNSGYKDAFFHAHNFGKVRGMLSAVLSYVSLENKEKDPNNCKYEERVNKLISELDSIDDKHSNIPYATTLCVMHSESNDGKTCQCSRGERTNQPWTIKDPPEFKELLEHSERLCSELGFDPGIVEISPQT